MSKCSQRFTALCAAVVLAAPLSFAAETRRQSRTDLLELAAELERALGKGSVVVERGPAGSGPPLPAPRVRESLDEHEAIVEAMNRERRAHGLGPLRLDAALSAAARDRVDDMFRQRYFAHVAPDGTRPFVWVSRHGYRYTSVGENLATGYRSAGAIVGGWMGSPGHRANILGRSFEDVGLAIAPASPTRKYAGPLVVAIYASR